MLRRLLRQIAFFTLALTFTSLTTYADDAEINTPLVLGSLAGEWELQPADAGAYKQRLVFHGGQAGQWRRSQEKLPVTITFYVEGNELLIQHYYEKSTYNFRLKTLTFAYKLEGDALTLTREGQTETWKRIPPPLDASLLRCDAPRMAPPPVEATAPLQP